MRRAQGFRIVAIRHRSPWPTVILMLACLAALAWIAGGEADEDLEQRRYCEMVALYKQDPSTGWPDYKGTYNSECRP